MRKKQFKAESKRLLDLMVNSIYTHKEIFLREIISNASDAIDKLCYLSLTDDKVGLNRGDFAITISVDKDARTLTVSDNGIGMSADELENNLGVIASSGSYKFRREQSEDADTDIIGQFGVGFYSAFMVADHITVVTKKYGETQAWKWESSGAEGYTVTEAERDAVGTDIIMHIKEDGEEVGEFSRYLEDWTIKSLVKKYSDYIRFPIKMLLPHSVKKPDSPDDKPEYETVHEWETLNSMVPLWQRKKSEVTKEEYDEFYRQRFGEMAPPQSVISVSAEGAVTYKALLFLPSKVPNLYYTQDFKPGLQLYSAGVMIMDHCQELLPEYFSFVRGVVDSPDLSLNISRELLQHDRQLKIISTNLEKKIISELKKLLSDDEKDALARVLGQTILDQSESDHAVSCRYRERVRKEFRRAALLAGMELDDDELDSLGKHLSVASLEKLTAQLTKSAEARYPLRVQLQSAAEKQEKLSSEFLI